MSERIFLYKLVNPDDKHSCIYIEQPKFEEDYFSMIALHGACFFTHKFANYEDIETILTKEEYNKLIAYNYAVIALGTGIVKGTCCYRKGIELCTEIQPIFDKLNSKEAADFYEEIIANEQKYIMEKYDLSYEDIAEIYNTYSLEYQDRTIIGNIYNDVVDLGFSEAKELGCLEDDEFDANEFGEDLLNAYFYYKLSDGRIVYLNYENYRLENVK